jgi:hypothetical protein
VSAEINANNQTTTGMATVIPWVNAPKLIESTSIISSPTPWYVYAEVHFKWDAISWWDGEVLKVDYIDNQLWEPNFTISPNWLRVRFPRDWVYHLDIYYSNWLSSAYSVNTDIYTNLQWTIASDVWDAGYWHQQQLDLSFKKWELLTVYCSVIAIWWWSWSKAPLCVIYFTRLW